MERYRAVAVFCVFRIAIFARENLKKYSQWGLRARASALPIPRQAHGRRRLRVLPFKKKGVKCYV